MKRGNSPHDASATAAEWYVALDAGAADEITDTRFASWLDRAAENEPELERCEAAVEIARRLADDPEVQWAYAEAAALAKVGRHGPTKGGSWRLRRPMLAFGLAALGFAAVAITVIVSKTEEQNTIRHTAAVLSPSKPISNATSIVALSPTSNAAIVLPTSRIVVDANSVAVMPFVEQSSATTAPTNVAVDLHRELVAALRAVPGFYAIGAPAVTPYAASELPASEIGAQLGARAVLSANIAVSSEDVLVTARLADAATDTLLWEARYERPIERLPTIQVDMLDSIVAALVDPELRVRAVRGITDPRAPNVVAATAADSAIE